MVMKITTLASVYISSYDVNMKIKELIPGKKQIRTVEEVSCHLDLGREVFEKRQIGYEKVDALCEILSEFKAIGDSYLCEEFLVYAGSTLKNAENMLFVLEQVRIRTGVVIRVLSNSEQRALSYRNISSMPEFETMTREGCILFQVGGSSLQITVFEKGHMRYTKQVGLGSLRLMRNLMKTRASQENKERQIIEMVEKEMNTFRGSHGGSRKNRHIILMAEYLDGFFEGRLKTSKEYGIEPGTDAAQVMEITAFNEYLQSIYRSDIDELSDRFENINVINPILYPSLVLYHGLLQQMNAEYVWLPGFEVTDGIAYDYAVEHKILKASHDFNDDVLSCADEIAERYLCYRPHIKAMENAALVIFDATKKINGMSKRDRLLLQTAVRLHDCGKYISMADHAQMSYEIIMASEILGLTHRERQVAAYAVKFIKQDPEPYDELKVILTVEEYLIVLKLAAIMRLANSLDRSHKQKLHEIKAVRKEKELVITVSVKENSAWEQAKFEQQAGLFMQVFSLRPVLREKKK